MKQTKLKKLPALKACLITLLFAIPFCAYLFLSTKQQLESAVNVQLQEISNFAKQQIAMDDSDNNNQFIAKLNDQLTGFSAVDAIAIMTRQYKIIFNSGSQNFRSVNPRHLNTQEEHLVQSNQHKIFVTPIMNKANRFSGWLLMEVNPKFLEQKLHRLINVLLMTCSAVVCFFIVALWLYRQQFLKAIGHISQLTKQMEPFDDTKSGFKELDKLSEQISELIKELSQVEISMAEEIKQTTDDLRETLETIEIQNVELDIARKEAVSANRTKSEFLANMSHEIRTPLNGIIGFTNLLLKNNLSQQQKDHLLTIRKSSEILLMIINDILDFSKIEAGKLLLDNQPINLRNVIDEVTIMLAPTAHAKNLELVHLHYQDVPQTIIGDQLRVKQVVTNLVNNAIKFTQLGEVVVRVMIDERDDIKIAVSDTGVGLSRAQQHSIFNAFSQADASTARNFGGTGLGLTISKKLIEQMNGKIGFESELGHGSTFWFTMPTNNSKIESDLLESPPLESLSHLEILCYEVVKPARFAIEHLLEEWQINSYTFSDLEQLIQRAQKKTVTFAIDRLFDDWKTSRPAQSDGEEMPVSSTAPQTEIPKDKTYITILCLDHKEAYQREKYELIRQLKQVNQKVLLVTPTLDTYDSEVIKEATAHLVKPVTHDRLLHTLTELSNEELDSQDQDEWSLRDELATLESQAVLVVDDNEINLNLMTALLENLNITPYAASDGYEAIELCKQELFPLIFMDIQMPGMDGVQTMKRIRQLDKSYQESAIIALTAYALPQERENFLNQGFQHLLTKPVYEAQLSEILGQYLLPEDRNKSHLEAVFSKEEIPSTEQNRQIVDLSESLHLSNGNTELAIDLMSRFLGTLPEQKEQIEALNPAEDKEQLERIVHKLHGACHYCGVPMLRAASLAAEHSLKLELDDIDRNIESLLREIDQLIHWHSVEQDSWKESLSSL